MTTPQVPEWLNERAKQIQEETNYINLKAGNNFVDVDLSVKPERKPTSYTNDDGKPSMKSVYKCTAVSDDNGRTWTPTDKKLSMARNLEGQAITYFMQGITRICIIRVGEGKQTRYQVTKA